jgi:hypothetical protein
MFCLYTKGNCGFISLYYALKFEKEDILKKYNIECVKDLYNLFMNEVFDKYKYQPHLKLKPVSIKSLFEWKFAVFRTQQSIIETSACNPLYWGMMAKYLNIHIKLIKIEPLEPSVRSRYDMGISYMSKINKQIINPECSVSIHISNPDGEDHAEYISKNDDEKKELYEFEKGRELIRDDINFWKDIEINDDDDDDDDFLKALEQDIQDLF